MYVNENMSGVSNVLGVMKAKHYITKNFLSSFNEDEAVKSRKSDGTVKSFRCKARKSDGMRRTYLYAAMIHPVK